MFGACPTDFDGQKTIYDFVTPLGVVSVDSCEYKVDPTVPIYNSLLKTAVAR